MVEQDPTLFRARVAAVIAATLISLACGTNYVFSAWGPQFAARMHLSSTETNLVATFGNLGMYLCGIPVGILTDRKGAKPGVLCGSLLVGFGYFMMHKAYDWGPGSVPLPMLCIFMFFTGLGGCAAFAGSIKTSAVNWPHHRGTATAFPLAAFGLSALFFASLDGILAPNDASEFLLILAFGGFSLIFFSSFFLQVVPYNKGYRPVSDSDSQNKLERVTSGGSRRALLHSEPERGEHQFLRQPDASGSISANSNDQAAFVQNAALEEQSNDDNDVDGPADTYGSLDEYDDDDDETCNGEEVSAESAHKSVYADVRGVQMLKYTEFYHYFLLMGLLTGVGLMTINNIGNDAQALWTKFDSTVPEDVIRRRQSIHVSILSFGSFSGRLASGIGSDMVVKKLHLSRIWCICGSSVVFALAQIFGLAIENPNLLYLLSCTTGLAYGFLFGCFPSVTAETFGIGGLSTNWGVLTLAPVIFANIFNLMYGRIYDSHTYVSPDHQRSCIDGRFCYHEAYWATLGSSLVGMVISLWCIWHQGKVKERLGWKGDGVDVDDVVNDHLA